MERICLCCSKPIKVGRADKKKYPDINRSLLKNSLIYFKDIRFQMPVNYIGRDIKWHEIEGRLKKAVFNPGLVFSRQHCQKLKLLEKKPRKAGGKRKGFGP